MLNLKHIDILFIAVGIFSTMPRKLNRKSLCYNAKPTITNACKYARTNLPHAGNPRYVTYFKLLLILNHKDSKC